MKAVEEILADRERAYDEAWNAGDVEAMLAVFGDGAVIVNPRGEEARGKAEIRTALAAFLTGAGRGSRYTSSVLSVALVTDDVAVVDGEALIESESISLRGGLLRG